MFKNDSKIWNWLVVSSADPSAVALTVKGWVSTIIPVLMIVIHNPNLSDLPNEIYAAIVAVFGIISAVTTAYGLIRKIILSFQPPAATGTPAT